MPLANLRPLPTSLVTRIPVFQGGMTFGSDARLVIAVAAAGGFGSLGTFHYRDDHQALAQEIAQIQCSGMANYSVNVPFFDQRVELVKRCCDLGVRAFTLGGWCNAEAIELKERYRLSLVGSVNNPTLIRVMADFPLDALVVQGNESGGANSHFNLRQLVEHALENTTFPIIAAGGLWDGFDLYTQQLLGCSAIQLGTRFFFCEESPLHLSIKRRIIDQAVSRAPTTELVPVGEWLRMRFLCNKAFRKHQVEGRLPEIFNDPARVFSLSRAFLAEHAFPPLIYAGAGIHKLRRLENAATILNQIAMEYTELQTRTFPPSNATTAD